MSQHRPNLSSLRGAILLGQYINHPILEIQKISIRGHWPHILRLQWRWRMGNSGEKFMRILPTGA